ncbi:hypothetical protein HDU87_008268 [Geranomyces variabilis]|uniref:Uncharacterized protein n=1 Tax=Geranomyces variabilis TaxID=109894 RepID=A0AAD5TFG5_9FUNG|nr:hypothetical protein HDU87_008268 [Geranomyces variabilis]
MSLSPRDPAAAYYGALRRRQFASVAAIDAFSAKSSGSNSRSPSNPTAHLRTVALAYFDAAAYSKAERFLRQYWDAVDQDDFEAMDALACTYVKLDKPIPALALYRQLLQNRPKSVSLALEVVRLSLLLAPAEDKSRLCQTVTSALRILQRCQDVHQKIPTEVLLALDETFKFVAQKCPECAIPTQLLPELLASAGLYETKRRESLHIWLARAILDSGVAESAWTYVTAHRQELGDSLPWLGILMQRFSDLELGCTSRTRDLDIAELNLWMHAAVTRQTFERDEQSSPEELLDLLTAFEQRLDATSSFLPLPDANATALWIAMRSEYTATLIMLRAMYDSRVISDELHIMSDVANCRPLIDAALSKWRLCMTYRELHFDHKLKQQAVQRLSLAGHNMLAILLCLESDQQPAHNPLTKTKIGDLPLLRVSYLAGAHLAKDVKSSLSWIQNDRLFLIDRDHFAASPWNLGRFANAAALYFSTDRLRMLLREIFPDMPESPTRNAGFDSARPTLTIADMEAFILRLLIRQTWWSSAVKMANPREAIFVACIGSWTPSAAQDSFWRTAIATNGKKALRCRHERMLDDEELSMWISEIRGAPPRDAADPATAAEKRNLCGRLGLLYADLAKSQGYREADARRYLEAWKKWNNAAPAHDAADPSSARNPPTIPDVAQADVDDALRAITYDRPDIIRAKSPLPSLVTPISGPRLELEPLSEESPGSPSPSGREIPGSPSPAPKTTEPAAPATPALATKAPTTPQPERSVDAHPSTPETTAAPTKMFSSARAQRHLKSLNELRSDESISTMLASSPLKPRRSLLDLLGTREPATPTRLAQPPSLSAAILMSTPTAANARPLFRPSFSPSDGAAAGSSPAAQRVAAVAAETTTTIIAPPRSPLGFVPRDRSAPPTTPAPPVSAAPPAVPAATATAKPTLSTEKAATGNSQMMTTPVKTEMEAALARTEMPRASSAVTETEKIGTAAVEATTVLPSARPPFRLVTHLASRFGGMGGEATANEILTAANPQKPAASPHTPTKIGARLERQMAMLEQLRQATPKLSTVTEEPAAR